MIRFNLPAAVISLLSVAVILLLVRRQRLGVLQTIWWLCMALGLLVLGLFPGLADWVGSALGIKYPPVLPILITLCLLVLKILTMDIQWTQHETKIRILAQKMAAYEAQLRELQEGGEQETEKNSSDED